MVVHIMLKTGMKLNKYSRRLHSMERIIFRIDQDGNVKEEVQGVQGNVCENLTKDIENRLGDVSGRIHKPEYYQQQKNVSDVTLQHNQNEN